jgi:hypothetical protein
VSVREGEATRNHRHPSQRACRNIFVVPDPSACALVKVRTPGASLRCNIALRATKRLVAATNRYVKKELMILPPKMAVAL